MAKKKKAAKKPISYRVKRFGIMNHIGGLWTPEVFDKPELAKRHIESYELRHKGVSLRRHRVVPVRVTVTVIQD